MAGICAVVANSIFNIGFEIKNNPKFPLSLLDLDSTLYPLVPGIFSDSSSIYFSSAEACSE